MSKPWGLENRIDDIKKRVAFIEGIGMDEVIGIARGGVAVETAPALSVFKDDDFAVKTIRVIKDSLDKAADKIAVGGAPVFPLSVDLDEDHVIRGDHSEGTAATSRSGSTDKT